MRWDETQDCSVADGLLNSAFPFAGQRCIAAAIFIFIFGVTPEYPWTSNHELQKSWALA